MKLPSCHRLRALALAALGASAVSLLTIERQPLADTDVPAAQGTGMMAANIATEPLYASYSGDAPTMALSLSVEYPTVGAQYAASNYNATTDSAYDPNKEYIGYYNAEMCYEYVDKPTEKIDGKTERDLKRFRITGEATKHKCDDAFSGNYLNWVSGSGIDMLRLALSGGDRWIDTPELTVLQRAFLPEKTGNIPCFFYSTNFPGKELKKSAGGGNYAGAVPKALQQAAADNGSTSIWVGNLHARMYFSHKRETAACWSGANNSKLGSQVTANSKPLNSDGWFFARVQVCDEKDERDYPLCTEYPSGHKKPTGVIQKYSDRLRLAAFGYALEQNLSHAANGKKGRTGGVLRAPMKFVGHSMMDKDGRDITAAALEDGRLRPEWDAETGVFTQNPEGDTRFGISGVINYLNQFGRTNEKTKGVYKMYDPASELYYETLRYMQGLSPTAAAVAGLTDDMYDGYPIYTDWTDLDPYGSKAVEGGYSKDDDYSCSKSNIVFIGDIHTHDAKHFGGSLMPARDEANNIPDIAHWQEVVQAFEMKQSRSYVDGQGNQQTTRNPNAASYSSLPGGTSGRGRTSEIIGLSYWAHTHDIRGTGWTAEADKEDSKQRPGLRVTSYFFDVNEYAESTSTSGRHSNNQLFTAAKYGGFLTRERADGLYNTTGNPFYDANGNPTNEVWSDLKKKIGDNTDPRSNPEARTYFMPANGRETLAAFEEIFNTAGSMQQRSIAGAANSGGLTGTNYQAMYDSDAWGGDVLAETFGGGAPRWSANAVLAADIASKGHGWRKIFMGYEDSDASPKAFAFTADTACDVDDVEGDLNAEDERCAD
ncbi:MAG: hypothetical protein J6T92_05585, partial [Ottowia sp.]|nr:hypothetical protein [Ottowia sp.]